MIDHQPFPPKPPPQRGVKAGASADTSGADPIGNALSRIYAATLVEPLPPALAELLRSLE